MSFQLRITGPAERDMRENHRWWSENRSSEQADRWLIGIDKIIYSLCETAEHHTLATETVLRKAGIRQVSFGLGHKPSHRIIYAINGQNVIIFRVRAFKQQDLDIGDLE